jgi:hypothetical protein
MLGEALSGQENYEEAQSLLEAGYQGLKKREELIPAVVRRRRLEEALDRLIQLAEANENSEDAKRWQEAKASLAGPNRKN